MKTISLKTDDQSFKEYLYSISPNSLIEHAKENLFFEAISDVILENEYLHKYCVPRLFKRKTGVIAKNTKSKLKTKLKKTDEEIILQLMSDVFPKNLLIDTLLAYTDEDAREDIIRNQLYWSNGPEYDINHN